MAIFQLVGSPEPFLLVDLKLGDKIYCEADAMVMMEPGLEIAGNLRGGLFQSFMRRFTTGESLFQQEIHALHAAGQCLLSPQLDGDMQILEIGQQQYTLSDGAFVAATAQVNVRAKLQSNLGGGFFGDTGGFVVMESSGQGQLCISGAGTLLEVDVHSDQAETIIDNGHVVAWDSRLQYSIGLPSSKNRGLVGNLVNSVTSSEGLVIKFKGHGKVIVCSRNRKNFVTWLKSVLPTTT